ncbi:2-oxo-3-deoxygalactonate kinase [Arthrobacter sp. TPD3018]|uniref:2-dehydro-3-deoxygalactonokinase n=1 Tax=Bacteria TaxID=2 RepID=UPI000D51C604|nr:MULTISPECIES: 2-dehydro-3-deoxygalactonokinase [Bacteria]PVE60282.1 2-oxo-3-deoxygalactonate kinase [Sphingomonas sp. TPD3009]PVE61800.1 2-oxo-3-deoxygalactonate kinase [Arthrobacter sp. TPD3018]PVE88076.1 2-oxo-3-deoxygalactonate kinase [Sphingomonas melonis]
MGTAMSAVIAIDWGTTNRRAYRIEPDGRVGDRVEGGAGVLGLAPGEYSPALADLRGRLGDLPVIAAGMVGSTRGWHEAPYAAAPADLAALAAAALRIEPERATIVPGVALLHGPRADVMRGEEVQVLGAIAAGLAPADALFCQPGTHNKWVATDGGRITDIATVMTGELFALLKSHGILAGMLDGAVADGPAFRDGVARGAGACDLGAALFEVRSGVLLGRRSAEDAAAYASGVLIGNDVGARDVASRAVHLLATGALAELYAVAIETCDGRVVPVDATAAFVAGIHHLRAML